MPPISRRRVDRQDWWKAIRDSDLPAQARLLAVTLSTWMNPDGSRCYPGQDAIADACGWGAASTVRRALSGLEKAGYIEVEKYGGVRASGRSQRTHRYWPTVPSGPDQPRAHAREEPGDQSSTDARQDVVDNRDLSGVDAREDAPDQPSVDARSVDKVDQPSVDARQERRPVAQSGTTSRASGPDQSSVGARQPDQVEPDQRGSTPSAETRPVEARPARGSRTPSWPQVWSTIERHVRRYGPLDHDRPDLDLNGTAAAALADIGGLGAVRNGSANHWDFRDAWNANTMEHARG